MAIDTENRKKKGKDPLISVIVPAFNIESCLSDCLDSILKQSYSNVEVVVIDDGSRDKTGQIADSYREKYPDNVVCIHQENAGVMKARFAGLEKAHGEWIGFVDGDDCIESNMYEKLLENAISHEADISHCGYQIVVNQGERIHYFYNTGRIVEQNTAAGVKDLLRGDFVEPSLCNKMFHRSLFDRVLQNKMLTKKYRFNEDLLLNYLLFKESEKAIYEDFCPYHYLARTGSATRTRFNADRILDPLAVQKVILDDAEGDIKQEAYRRYLQTNLHACYMLYGRPDQAEAYKGALKVLKEYDRRSGLLGKNTLLKLRLICFSPALYVHLYRFYERFFQKKRYE